MKVFGIIVKIALALAAVAGIVYLAATYGDRVVAWAKGLLKGKCCCGGNCDCDCEEGECIKIPGSSERNCPIRFAY